MAAGLSPEQTAENWSAVRRYGRRWMLGLCVALALAMYAVGYARGSLSGYLSARPAPAATAPPCPPAPPPRK